MLILNIMYKCMHSQIYTIGTYKRLHNLYTQTSENNNLVYYPKGEGQMQNTSD